MGEGAPHHLPLLAEHVWGNEGRGRVFFLPGSDGRARRIAERFCGVEVLLHERQHNVYLGRLERQGVTLDAAAVSTGMGCTSLNVIVTELIALGARLLLRVGTSGSLAPSVVRVGSLVIATAAVRDEAASDLYISRDYPAIACSDWVVALRDAALAHGYGERTFAGIVHAKDSLYAVEFDHGPLRRSNRSYMAALREMRVLASDMETSHLFVLSDVHSSEITPLSGTPSPSGMVRSGSILAVVGDDAPFAPPEAYREAEDAAIEVALDAAALMLR